MEYERQVIIIRIRFNRRRALIFLAVVLSAITTFSCFLYIKMHPVVIIYAISTAETLVQDAANKAVINILGDNNIAYDDIVCLARDSSGYVTSLEIDVVEINRLKSSISNEISKILAEEERYEINIPIGTFFGSEYTSGLGPDVCFKMQITSTALVDFENSFTDAGINQVLHKVLIKIKTSGNLILTGSKKTFSVETSAIAAQTVIVGSTPEAFTEVVESPTEDSAGIINDYGAY